MCIDIELTDQRDVEMKEKGMMRSGLGLGCGKINQSGIEVCVDTSVYKVH